IPGVALRGLCQPAQQIVRYLTRLFWRNLRHEKNPLHQDLLEFRLAQPSPILHRHAAAVDMQFEPRAERPLRILRATVESDAKGALGRRLDQRANWPLPSELPRRGFHLETEERRLTQRAVGGVDVLVVRPREGDRMLHEPGGQQERT